MNKTILLLPLIIFLCNCSSPTGSENYFGQAYPDTIPVIFAPDIISQKGRIEHGISFAPNGKELAFGVLKQDDLSGEIWYSKRERQTWAKPLPFEPLKGRSVYLPYFSPDGASLLFAQSKSGTDHVHTDLCIVRKKEGLWGAPTVLYDPISSESREANGSMTSDGTLYFSSNRNCIGKENCHTADLFYSRPINNHYQEVQIISELSSSNDEESIFISPDEEYLIFCSYTDEKTAVDLYISYRDIHKNWITPQRVHSTINSKEWERRPYVSSNNQFLFFTRMHIGADEITESDIYWVGTSKLFKPFVFHPVPDITAQVGKAFHVSLPTDYFKDMDDQELAYTIGKNKPDWLHFDSARMTLSGVPTKDGEFELIVTARDHASNRTDTRIRLTVKR